MKWIFAVAFLLIIGSLGSALFFLVRDQGRTRNTLHALGWRVGFSVALFAFIMLAQYFGWIQPGGIPVGR